MTKEVKLKEIEEEVSVGDWVTIKAKVLEIWPNKSESISQIGLLGDETGQLKFISWEKSNLPNLNTGKVYSVKNAVVDEWKEELQLSLNKNTKVTILEENLQVKQTNRIEGKILALTNRTGAILKCPLCSRTVEDNICVVHGEIEPLKNLRIGLAIKENNKIKKVEFSGEEANEVARITPQEAHEMDHKKLISYLEDLLVGGTVNLRYFESSGVLFGKDVKIN